MNRITKYKVICEYDTEVFEKGVNKAIDGGFQPFGSISSVFAPNEERIYHHQAMVLFESQISSEASAQNPDNLL